MRNSLISQASRIGKLLSYYDRECQSLIKTKEDFIIVILVPKFSSNKKRDSEDQKINAFLYG